MVVVPNKSGTGGTTVTPNDPSAGAKTTYRLDMDVEAVPVGSSVEITLPAGATISDLVAKDAITGNALDITTKTDANGKTVAVIKAFPGPPGSPPTTGKVVVDFGTITNPNAGPLGKFDVVVKDPVGAVIKEDI